MLGPVNWDDLRFFLVLSRRRTLSAAARELKVSQPTVGRRIAALERRIGAKLFVRHPDRFELSSSGSQAFEQAESMEREALAFERRVSGRDQGVSGTVRVTTTEWLATGVLSPLLGPLLSRHPELTVELVADQRHLNLARREADVALRARRFDQDGIVQRATAKLSFGLYATRDYLAGRGSLSKTRGRGHLLISMTDDVGDVARDWLHGVLPEAKAAARANGRDAMLSLAVAGVGVACLARIVGDQVPSLERLAIPAAPIVTLWMGVHRDARTTPRVQAVSSYLAERLKALQPKLCPA